jgi:hypothetical protein
VNSATGRCSTAARIAKALTIPFARAVIACARAEVTWLEGASPQHRLEKAGDSTGAAQWWEERGCAYDAALALAGGDRPAQRRALDMLQWIGARPAAAIVARRLAAQGERGLPRGLRPVTLLTPQA